MTLGARHEAHHPPHTFKPRTCCCSKESLTARPYLASSRYAVFMGTFSLQLEEGAKLQTPHTDLKDASKIGSWEKFKLYVVPGHHRIYVIQTMTNHLLTAVDGGGRAAEPVFQTDRTYVNAWEKFNLFKRFQWNFIRVSSGNYARLVNDVIHTDGNNQAIDHSFGFLFYKCGDPVSNSLYHISWASGTDPAFPPYNWLQAYDGGKNWGRYGSMEHWRLRPYIQTHSPSRWTVCASNRERDQLCHRRQWRWPGGGRAR